MVYIGSGADHPGYIRPSFHPSIHPHIIEHLILCEFDYRTNRTNRTKLSAIEQNRTVELIRIKSNKIETDLFSPKSDHYSSFHPVLEEIKWRDQRPLKVSVETQIFSVRLEAKLKSICIFFFYTHTLSPKPKPSNLCKLCIDLV